MIKKIYELRVELIVADNWVTLYKERNYAKFFKYPLEESCKLSGQRAVRSGSIPSQRGRFPRLLLGYKKGNFYF